MIRHPLPRALLLLALGAALTGCEVLSSDYWHSPSILSTQPPPPPPEVKHEKTGGFTVLVGGPGQPGAAQVFADIGTFAQQRGFVRGSGSPFRGASAAGEPAGPQRYSDGDITLDVSYQSARYRVTASVHGLSARINRRYVHEFAQGFRQQYGAAYGDEAGITENEVAEGAGVPSRGGAPGRGGRRR